MTSKTVKTSLTDDGSLYIEMSEFSDFINTSKVHHYELFPEETGILIKFYDEDGNIINTT